MDPWAASPKGIRNHSWQGYSCHLCWKPVEGQQKIHLVESRIGRVQFHPSCVEGWLRGNNGPKTKQ